MSQGSFRSLRDLGFSSGGGALSINVRHASGLMRKVLTSQFVRYAVMGGLAALFQLLLLALFVEVAGMPALLSSTLALAISVLVNYVLQHRVTFRSRIGHAIAGPRFLIFALGTLGANAALFGTLSTALPYLVSQILTTGVIFPINYLLNKNLTFRA